MRLLIIHPLFFSRKKFQFFFNPTCSGFQKIQNIQEKELNPSAGGGRLKTYPKSDLKKIEIFFRETRKRYITHTQTQLNMSSSSNTSNTQSTEDPDPFWDLIQPIPVDCLKPPPATKKSRRTTPKRGLSPPQWNTWTEWISTSAPEYPKKEFQTSIWAPAVHEVFVIQDDEDDEDAVPVKEVPQIPDRIDVPHRDTDFVSWVPFITDYSEENLILEDAKHLARKRQRDIFYKSL